MRGRSSSIYQACKLCFVLEIANLIWVCNIDYLAGPSLTGIGELLRANDLLETNVLFVRIFFSIKTIGEVVQDAL